jgi:DNA-binding NarL/FixJ family response regulator
VRRSAHCQLQEATESLARLAETAARTVRSVVVARLSEPHDELPQVLAQCEGLPVVALLPEARRGAIQGLRAGASAILPLDADVQQLGAAVLSAFHGLAVMPADAAELAEPPPALAIQPEALTARELEILALLAAGDSNKMIAARLSISIHTVKFHISSILAKLGVSSRTEAVALGLRLGLVLL